MHWHTHVLPSSSCTLLSHTNTHMLALSHSLSAFASFFLSWFVSHSHSHIPFFALFGSFCLCLLFCPVSFSLSVALRLSPAFSFCHSLFLFHTRGTRICFHPLSLYFKFPFVRWVSEHNVISNDPSLVSSRSPSLPTTINLSVSFFLSCCISRVPLSPLFSFYSFLS